jgi:hypothetical protein
MEGDVPFTSFQGRPPLAGVSQEQGHARLLPGDGAEGMQRADPPVRGCARRPPPPGSQQVTDFVSVTSHAVEAHDWESVKEIERRKVERMREKNFTTTSTGTGSQSVSETPSERSLSASWCTEDAKAEVAGEVEHQRKNDFAMTPRVHGAPIQSGNTSPRSSLSTSCCTEDAKDAVALEVEGKRRSWQTPA